MHVHPIICDGVYVIIQSAYHVPIDQSINIYRWSYYEKPIKSLFQSIISLAQKICHTLWVRIGQNGAKKSRISSINVSHVIHLKR